MPTRQISGSRRIEFKQSEDDIVCEDSENSVSLSYTGSRMSAATNFLLRQKALAEKLENHEIDLQKYETTSKSKDSSEVLD